MAEPILITRIKDADGIEHQIDYNSLANLPEGLATETYVDNKVEELIGYDSSTLIQLATDIENKVDKVDGMGLSSNDFTDEEKTKLNNISDGAEVNVNADWNATSGDAQILNKPTNVSEFTNDAEYTSVQLIKWGIDDTSSSVGETTEDGEHVAYIAVKTPSLSDSQKSELVSLMDDYLNSGLFIYDGSNRRESYAYPNYLESLDSTNINGCKYKDEDGNDYYIINCGTFAQMIWMGRAISDFTETPSTAINTAFDWGYYFDFLAAKRAYGVTMNSGAYYGANTYTSDLGNTLFKTFDGAATMASELYAKGCEIPYSDVEVGDLVFYRSPSTIDGSTDTLEQTVFRYITHVGIVYSVDPTYGPTIIESSNVWAAAIGKCGLGNDVSKFGSVRGADQEQRVCMAARHPAAFGFVGNVPSAFEVYRGTETIS